MPSEQFLRVQGVVRGREGGWNHVPGDQGGETIFGVARLKQPNWFGWAMVDAYAVRLGRGTPEFIQAVNEDPALYQLAMDLFQAEYYNPLRGDELPYNVVLTIYDLGINSGPRRAAKTLQKTVRAMGGDPTVSGKPTDDQVVFIRDVMDSDSADAFIETLLYQRWKFYLWLAAEKPAKYQWSLKGWKNRLIHLAMDMLKYIPKFLED